MRKALVVGLNWYPDNDLQCCNNDADDIASLLEKNEDGSRNFDVYKATHACSKNVLEEDLRNLFADENDVALFYFSGHGSNGNEPSIVSSDSNEISMNYILDLANSSRAKNKVIILDACFSGNMGNGLLWNNDISTLSKGVTIITACERWQVAVETAQLKHGIFTNLLIEGLKGGAANINGKITPASLYSFVDQSLGSWEQRPVFKTNISQLLSIRDVIPKVTIEKLRRIARYFEEPDAEYALNPSYEYTNTKNEVHKVIEPYADLDNVKIFKDLQCFVSLGLVEPVGAEHMYFAAMESKACKLTALGKHYWRLAEDNRF